MDKLIIPNGGMFFEGDDIRWIYAGLEGALTGALYPFLDTHSGNVILSGCDISLAGSNASITAGYVMIGGEICYCAPQTVAVTSLAASSLKVVETYDADGLEVFADSVSRNTYAVRRAVISDGLNSGDEIVLSNPKRLSYSKTFTNSDLNNNWSIPTGVTLKATLFAGRVYWQGRVTGDSTSNDIFGADALPLPLVPADDRVVLAHGSNGSMLSIGFRDADLDGRVIASDLDGNAVDFSAATLYLDGVNYAL